MNKKSLNKINKVTSFLLVLTFGITLNVYALNFIENNSATFNGTPSGAGLGWSTAENAYGTNGTVNSNLTYTSQIKNATALSTFNNFGFSEKYIYNRQLSGSMLNETLTNSKGIDMTGNLAYYNFDAIGSWPDLSGNGNNGIAGPIAPDSTTDSVFSRALQNNNQNSKLLRLPSGVSIAGRSEVTIGFWFKTTAINVNKVLYQEAVGNSALASPGGRLTIQTVQNVPVSVPAASDVVQLSVRTSDTATTDTILLRSSKVIAVNNWYHLVVVINATTDVHKIYLNGVPETSTVAIPPFPSTVNTNTNFRPTIANNVLLSNTGTKFNGRFDEFAIFTRELTQLEITKYYVRGKWRVGYQVKLCLTSTCTGNSFLGPTGTTGVQFAQINNPVFPLQAVYTLNPASFPDSQYYQYIIYFYPLPSSPNLSGATPEQAYVYSVNIDYTIVPVVLSNIDLSFDIKNDLDTFQTNSCDLGEVNTAAVSKCSYRLKVSTNNPTGYNIFLKTTTGLLNSSNNVSLQNANGTVTLSNANAGTESYGINIVKGSVTSGAVTGLGANFNNFTNNTNVVNTPQLLMYSDGLNAPANTDLANSTLIEHSLNISADSDAGSFSQDLEYTVVVKF